MMTPSLMLAVMAVIICNNLQASSKYAVLEARPAAAAAGRMPEAKITVSACVVFNKKHQNLPSDVTETRFRHLVNLYDSQGCTAEDFANLSASLENSVVAVARGNCTFIQKARLVQKFKGSAVLVVEYKNATKPTVPSGSVFDFQSINVLLVTIEYKDYISVVSLSEFVDVALYVPSYPLWDSKMIVLIFLPAVLTVSGAGWAAYDECQSSRGSQSRHEHTSVDCEDKAEISLCDIMTLFILMCSLIILLYFFYDYLVYVFIAAFFVAGTYSLYRCLLPVCFRLLPVLLDRLVNLPCMDSKVKLRSLILLLLCVTFGIYWVCERHSLYAWIFQDVLGAAFCIFFIRSFHLQSLKLISILLVLLMMYDVCFVFVTPLLTKDGKSVMESIVVGERGHSGELLPMMFLVPSLSESKVRKCISREFSLVGFGDVILPGLLVSYNAIFDVKTGNRMIYFVTSSLGYLFGMIVCVVSLSYMRSGQPALLYLVPATLLPTLVVALARKEFRRIFFGLSHQKAKSGEHQELETQGIDVNSEGKDVNIESIDVNNNCRKKISTDSSQKFQC